MRYINRQKLVFVFLLSCLSVQPLRASLFAVGPSAGLSGNYASFGLQDQPRSVVIHNCSLQIGLFAKLSLGILYAKVDPLFVLDWRRFPDAVNTRCFQHITLPITIGIPLLGFFRPHFGLVCRIPFSSDFLLKETDFIRKYKEKINGWLLGIGIDLGHFVMDLDFERALSSINRRSIHAAITHWKDFYTPKQFSLRIGYNLLNSIG